MREIDQINKMVDDPRMLKKYGRYHREHWGHDVSATARDSVFINRGNAEREKVRKVHILVDTNPKIKLMVKRMELREELRKLRK
jgi:hypothetical protein